MFSDKKWPVMKLPSSKLGSWRLWNPTHSTEEKSHKLHTMYVNLNFWLLGIHWKLYSSFLSGVWKRNNGSGKTIDAGPIVEIGFAQGPKKLNDGSGKTNYPGTIDRGFTVYSCVSMEERHASLCASILPKVPDLPPLLCASTNAEHQVCWRKHRTILGILYA
jgi:hypothetical protein